MASLVVGILSLPLLFACGFGAITGIAAIVLGLVGLQTAKKMGGNGKGLAIGGIVTGALGLLAGVAFFALVVMASDDISNDLDEINTDPADGTCDFARFIQDPDC